MLQKAIHKVYLSTSKLITPKKIKPINPLTHIRQIADKFKIIYNPNDTNQQITEKYLKYLENAPPQTNLKLMDILYMERKCNFIELTKQQITKFKQFDDRTQRVINNFITLLLQNLTNKKLQVLTFQTSKFWEQQIIELINCVNQFSFFIEKDKYFCLNFLRMVTYISGKAKIHRHESFSISIRAVLDKLIQLPSNSFKPHEVMFLLFFLSIFNVHIWHYKKSNQILKTIWGSLPPDWHLNPSLNQTVIKRLPFIGIESKDINQKLWAIFFTQQVTPELKAQTLSVLIKNFQITSKNCEQQKIKSVIVYLIQNYKEFLFVKCNAEFYRAGIWMKEFWVPFFEYMMVNYERLTLYNIFVIIELLQIEKDGMSPEVYQKGKLFEQKMKQIYEKITVHDIQKQYQRQYSSFHRRISCQVQMANSFRLLTKGQVRTQVPLGIFNVDILMHNKFVVEVNGGSHYIYDIDSSNKKYSLKSEFREKILPKLGYKVFNVDIYQFNEGSFELISVIFKQIEKLEKQQQEENQEQSRKDTKIVAQKVKK